MDFPPLTTLARRNLQRMELSPASLVTEPAAIATVGPGEANSDREIAAGAVPGEVRTRATKDSLVHGIGVWFRSTLVEGIELTNGPPNAVPRWDQGLLPLEHLIAVAAGQSAALTIRVSADGSAWAWSVDVLPE